MYESYVTEHSRRKITKNFKRLTVISFYVFNFVLNEIIRRNLLNQIKPFNLILKKQLRRT